MQFLNLALLSMATFSALPVEACKCFAMTLHSGHTNRPDITEKCCANVGGQLVGDDCAANSISKWMSGFASCCRTSGNFVSDCKGGMNCC